MQRHQGSGSRGPSQRQLRVGELLRAALSETLARGDVQDPVLQNAIITVSEVRASPDLKNATAYVVPLGHDDPQAVVAALTRATRFIRGVLARQVSLKYMPNLTFRRIQLSTMPTMWIIS